MSSTLSLVGEGLSLVPGTGSDVSIPANGISLIAATGGSGSTVSLVDGLSLGLPASPPPGGIDLDFTNAGDTVWLLLLWGF